MASSAAPERGRNIDLEGAYRAAEERFTAANPGSLAQYERACESLPGGNTRTGMYYAPYPLAMARGEVFTCHNPGESDIFVKHFQLWN